MSQRIIQIKAKSRSQNSNSFNSFNNNTNNTIDVSFSIPDWKQQQIKSLNQQYQKEIYTAVPLSLTDFDSKEQVEFLSKPEKCIDQKFAYQRKLIHAQDFSILAFILCLQQTLIGDQINKDFRLQKFKKKLNQLDLCVLTNIPVKMSKYYDNKVLKKILFQYINKGSYNVSLLQILLRRNLILKFALSLVSKSILKNRKIISSYSDTTPFYIQMRTCGDQFGVLSTIKVKQKFIETQNFLIQIGKDVKMFRKQNIIQLKLSSNIKKQNKRPSSSQAKLCNGKYIKRKSTKQQHNPKQLKSDQQLKDKYSERSNKSKNLKRSNSLVTFFKKFLCF